MPKVVEKLIMSVRHKDVVSHNPCHKAINTWTQLFQKVGQRANSLYILVGSLVFNNNRTSLCI